MRRTPALNKSAHFEGSGITVAEKLCVKVAFGGAGDGAEAIATPDPRVHVTTVGAKLPDSKLSLKTAVEVVTLVTRTASATDAEPHTTRRMGKIRLFMMFGNDFYS